MSHPNTTLLIGLGNPILGDDGVGWRVIEEVQSQLNGQVKSGEVDVEFDFLSLGGLALMERMVGYHHVILADSITTGSQPAGAIFNMPLSQLPNFSAGHTTAAHDTSLQTALQVGRQMGCTLPGDVWVVAVEARRVYSFTEELSPPVAAAVSPAADRVIAALSKDL